MRKFTYLLILGVAILTLSGCGGGVNYKSTTEEIKAKVTSSYDAYQKRTTITGPTVSMSQNGEGFMSAHWAKWFIRGWKSSGPDSYQIYVVDKTQGGGFRGFRSATNINGKEHKFTRIDTDIDVSCWGGRGAGCNTYYTEDFGVSLTRDDMDAGLQDSINIQVYSKSGKTRTIIVNPKYINAILDVVDAN
jgi:hypothetical protein